MGDKTKTDFLRKSEIVKNLSESILPVLSDLFEIVDYAEGEKIFSEGSAGDSLYIIAEGKIIIKSSEVILAERFAGECIGEMSLIDGSPRSASAFAGSDVRALKLEVDKFSALLANEPMIGFNLFKILSSRIREDINRQKQNIKELNKVNEELRKLNGLKENILSNISHELRTPLTIIKGYNELLLNKESANLNETQKEQLKKSLSSVENLNFAVGNLIELSKLKSGKYDLNFREFDINLKINEILKTYSYKAEIKKIELNFERAKNEIEIFGDDEKLTFAICNLIDNAIKFNKENGKIIIRTNLDSNFFKFEIYDTGVGFSEDDKENFFDIFYQKDVSSKRRYGGSGIGLSICKEIIKIHNGSLAAESEAGKWSRFYFIINALPVKM